MNPHLAAAWHAHHCSPLSLLLCINVVSPCSRNVWWHIAEWFSVCEYLKLFTSGGVNSRPICNNILCCVSIHCNVFTKITGSSVPVVNVDSLQLHITLSRVVISDIWTNNGACPTDKFNIENILGIRVSSIRLITDYQFGLCILPYQVLKLSTTTVVMCLSARWRRWTRHLG